MERFFARRTRRKTQIFSAWTAWSAGRVRMYSGLSGRQCRLARESWPEVFGDMSTSSPNHALQRTRLLRFGWAMSRRFAQRPVGRVAELWSFGDCPPFDVMERFFARRTRRKTQIFPRDLRGLRVEFECAAASPDIISGSRERVGRRFLEI